MKKAISLFVFFALLLSFSLIVQAESYPFGDVNMGIRVTLSDAEAVAAYKKGERTLSTVEQTAADVNFSGSVELTDALLISLFENGSISVLGSGRILPAVADALQLSVGESLQLSVFIPTTLPAVTWSTEDDNLLSLTEDGRISGRREGTAQVVAALPGRQSTGFRIRITPAGIAHGMDVSEFQENIDWQRVKRSNRIDFAILRAGYAYGSDCTADSLYRQNYRNATQAGIPLGAYLYAVPTSVEEARLQARWLLRQVENDALTYPLVLDLEDASLKSIDKNRITTIALAFLQTIEDGGRKPMLYTDLDFLENNLIPQRLADYDLWIADYNSAPPKTTIPYQIWQYEDDGQIPGVPTRVDLDIAYGDYTEENSRTTTENP